MTNLFYKEEKKGIHYSYTHTMNLLASVLSKRTWSLDESDPAG